MNKKFTAPNAHILIVDDMPVNLKMTSLLLKPLDMQIDTAENGKEALEKIFSFDYDLIFMDHMMPVMDGAEAVTKIRNQSEEKYQNLPVIALTSHSKEEAIQLMAENGFSDYLNKPVNKDELLSCILKWLPMDKIQTITDSSSGRASDSSDEYLSEEIKVEISIPGIDPAIGIRNSGNERLFIGLLGDVHGIIEDKCALIEKLLDENEIKNYTVQVHGLKTTCRMIGATSLAERFRALEMYGNSNEIMKIKEETSSVLADFRALLPYLSPYVEDEKVADKDYDPQAIAKILSNLKKALTDYNLTAAEDIIDYLISFRYPAGLSEKIKDLEKLVVELDYDLALDLADSILQVVNSKETH